MKTRRLFEAGVFVILLPFQVPTHTQALTHTQTAALTPTRHPYTETSQPSRINKDSLLADFDYFMGLLESTHPDPYSGFGGEVFFHQKAFELRNELAGQFCSLEAFWEKTMAFLSPLQDSHTYLNSLEKTPDNLLCIPIGFRFFSEGLIVQMLAAVHPDLSDSFSPARLIRFVFIC